MANANPYLYPSVRGKPLKITDPKQLQKAIDNYLKYCFIPKSDENGGFCKDADGNIIYEVLRPPTMTGLANALNLSRSTLLDYKAKAEYSDSITRARRIIEQFAEEHLYSRESVQGAKFALINNHIRWAEKTEVAQTTENLLGAAADQPAQLTTGDTSAILSALKAIIVRLTPEAEQVEELKEVNPPK